MPLMLRTLLSLVLLVVGSRVIAQLPEAQPVDGPAFRALPAAISAAGEVCWQGGTQPPTAPGELVEWGAPVDPPPTMQVVLPRGGVMPAGIGPLSDDALQLETGPFGGVKWPLGQLAAVLFAPPAGRAERDQQLLAIIDAQGTNDTALLINGDRLNGTLTALDRARAELASDLGSVPLERAKLAALILNPAAIERVPEEQLPWWVGLTDGTRLRAAWVELTEGQLKIDRGGGTPALATTADHLAWLQACSGRATWLGTLEPVDYRHIPYLDLTRSYAVDRSVAGELLRVRGRLYLRGIGMTSAARLTYKLDGAYRRFDALVAIDDTAGGHGSVVFRVYVDQREAFKSPEVRGDQPPLPISVDCTGGKLLSLIVDFGARADELDHAAWLNARLVK